jgi:nitrogen fixation NifU-like protein
MGASLSAMYQEALLAHHRAPRNRREMIGATSSAVQKNPVCGDELRVMVLLDGARIADVAFVGQSCSIATASASLMTDAVMGTTVREALRIATALEAMLAGDREAELPASLEPLRGVAPFAGRHGCARMAWTGLREALG